MLSGSAEFPNALRYTALGADASAVAGLKRQPDGKADALYFDSIVTGVNEAEVRRQAQISADDLARRAGSDQFKKRPWRSMAI